MVNLLRNANLTIVIVFLITSWIYSTSSSVYDSGDALQEKFEKWLETHRKVYGGRDEWMQRFGIYQSNVQLIDYINSLDLPFKLTDNKFADMTNSEFKAKYLGLNTSSLSYNASRSICNPEGEVPKTVDWREKGAVTPVKNQGRCGGCWAFSAVAAIEGINKIKTGKLISLSEQELIDCDTDKNNQGCNGGLMDTAFEFIKSNGGLTTEANYPYKAIEGTCNKTRNKNHVVTIKGYKRVGRNEESLKAATAQQPVSVGIDAEGFAFQFYSSGIFTGYCGTYLNHAVTVVGYGEDRNRNYWIVKNSWGKSWGEEGYIRMERDISDKRGTCGITMMPSYPLQ